MAGLPAFLSTPPGDDPLDTWKALRYLMAMRSIPARWFPILWICLATLALPQGEAAAQQGKKTAAPKSAAPAAAKKTGPAAPDAKTTDPTARKEPLLQKVAVIGASISNGFGLDPQRPQDPRFNLAKVVDRSIRGPHAPPLDLSSSLTFMDPHGTAKAARETLLAEKPSLIVAIDFLFWFGYGTGKDAEGRMASLEQGLDLLEGLTGPILLGDLPDVRHVLETPHPIIPADAIPTKDSLARLNNRITNWARGRNNVILVPAADLMRSLVAGEEVRCGPNTWTKEAAGALLQPDRLHATLEGTAALWVMAADRLRAGRPEVPSKALDREVPSLLKKLDPSAISHATTPQTGAKEKTKEKGKDTGKAKQASGSKPPAAKTKKP